MNAKGNPYSTRWPEYVTAAEDILRTSSGADVLDNEITAVSLREAIFDAGHKFVELDSLLSHLALRGIPVQRIPGERRHPIIGLAVTRADRAAIILSDSHNSPSRLACDLAHLVGHVCLGHLRRNDIITDVVIDWTRRAPPMEREANEFALTLLTGEPKALFNANFYRDNLLAQWARRQSDRHRIAPAIALQIYARQTGRFPLANRACRAIELV